MDNKGFLYAIIVLLILGIIGFLYYMSRKHNANGESSSQTDAQTPLTPPVTIKPLKKSFMKKKANVVECNFDGKGISEVSFLVSLNEALKIDGSDSKRLTPAQTLKKAEENLKKVVDELAAYNGGDTAFKWYGYVYLDFFTGSSNSQILSFTAKFGNAHRATITKLNSINLKYIQKCLANSLD